MSDKCHPYPGTPVPPCPPNPCRPCPPPPPPFKPLPGGTQQYIGARYVPVFAEPIEWNINKPYESLTIVTYQGSSYTSKCAVPGGTDITNTRYWAKTGDYNAQVAEYRAAVGDLSTQVTGFAKDNAEFREKITQYNKDNAAMKNEVAAATARVDDLAKRVDTAEADIDGLQATTNQHTQKLADLEAADTRLAQSIADNDTDIANLQTKDVQHDSEISAIKTVNNQQGAAIAQNTADIAQNKKNIADNARNIAENAAELAEHANTLKEHTADLAALHRDVQDNKTAIAKNASDIVGLRADLTEAEADIAQNTDGLNHVKTDIVRIDAKDAEQDKAIANKMDKTELDGYVTATTFSADQKRQDDITGDWSTAHPGQTISECATSQENELAEHAGQLTKLEADKADQSALDKLARSKLPVPCIGAFFTSDEHALTVYPKPITEGEHAFLKEDAEKLAVKLNAAAHTHFKLTGIATPISSNTAPIYGTISGTITGDFTVAPKDESDTYYVLTAYATVTTDLPRSYVGSSFESFFSIGSDTDITGVSSLYPVFPEYFTNQ